MNIVDVYVSETKRLFDQINFKLTGSHLNDHWLVGYCLRLIQISLGLFEISLKLLQKNSQNIENIQYSSTKDQVSLKTNLDETKLLWDCSG